MKLLTKIGERLYGFNDTAAVKRARALYAHCTGSRWSLLLMPSCTFGPVCLTKHRGKNGLSSSRKHFVRKLRTTIMGMPMTSLVWPASMKASRNLHLAPGCKLQISTPVAL